MCTICTMCHIGWQMVQIVHMFSAIHYYHARAKRSAIPILSENASFFIRTIAGTNFFRNFAESKTKE